MVDEKRETLWEKTGIERDSVARRVLNTSETPANITAKELEGGVSLETLLALNVPVYRYGGQITIHGSLPDLHDGAMPAGYKCIVKNGNGSIGVRYVGIDAKKKMMLCRIAGMYENHKLRCDLDSRGLMVSANFNDPELCKAVYDTIDQSLFYGRVCAFRWMNIFSGKYVFTIEIGIDAIPADNLWLVAANLFGCPNEASFRELERLGRENQERENEIYKQERAKEDAKRAIELARHTDLCKAFAATIPKKPLTRVPSKTGDSFLIVIMTKNGDTKLVRTHLRNVFGKLCYATSSDLTAGTKGLKFQQAEYKLSYWQSKLADGLIFGA